MTTLTKTRIGQLDCTVAEHPDSKTTTGAVILCHGYGAPGTDLVSLADEMFRADPSICDVQFVFPQALLELDPMFDSRAWWRIDIERIQQLMLSGEFRELRQTVPDRLSECRAMVEHVVQEIMDENRISAEKIVVGGFSQGAMLTTDVALNFPEQLGGLIVWSGSLINEEAWRTAVKSRSGLQVVQSHGSLDPILPFTGAVFLRDMFRENGVNVQFIEFNGPHTISMDALIAAMQMIKQVSTGNDKAPS